jgi:hypothetical protein
MNEASDYLTREQRLKASQQRGLNRQERRAIRFNQRAQGVRRSGGDRVLERYRKNER